jgi:hypothetical protein
VLEIAWVLRDGGFDDVAARLEDAVRLETKVLALTITEREMILRVLDDPPTSALAELRGVLVRGNKMARARGARLVGEDRRDGPDRHRRSFPLAIPGGRGVRHQDRLNTTR